MGSLQDGHGEIRETGNPKMRGYLGKGSEGDELEIVPRKLAGVPSHMLLGGVVTHVGDRHHADARLVGGTWTAGRNLALSIR